METYDMRNNKTQLPQRDGYGQGLLELCSKRDDIMVLDADVSASTRTAWVAKKYPEKFQNMGISEQDMVGTAAGLVLGGMIPFVSTYGVFLSGRAWDQICTTVCYNNLAVKFGGAHTGISVGPDGATHQALEDIALMRVLPNMTVIAPCDAIETRKATIAASSWDGPVYIRFGREAVPVITDENTPFEIGKPNVVRYGNDIAFIACGALVNESLRAAEILAKKGISATILNLHTIKPLDETVILEASDRCGAIITAEEHQIHGGLGSAVAELLGREKPTTMQMMGINDRFGQSGPPDKLMEYYGLIDFALANAAINLLSKKK